MNKLILVTIMLLNLIFSQETILVNAENRYARIETTTEIYKSTSGKNNIENIYCLAEQTYYVEIIGDYDNYYKVNYNGINGFIKKNDVKEISNTPSTPYPNNIKLIIKNNCNLRSSPTTNSTINNIITTLHTNEENFIYVGRVLGEEAIDFGGSTWYYVNYNGNYGYIYNNYIKSITPIYSNNEQFTYLSVYKNTTINPITHTPSLILIIILMLPLFLLLIILYLPNKHKNKSRKTKSVKIIDKY